jgi:hypothetical protein
LKRIWQRLDPHAHMVHGVSVSTLINLAFAGDAGVVLLAGLERTQGGSASALLAFSALIGTSLWLAFHTRVIKRYAVLACAMWFGILIGFINIDAGPLWLVAPICSLWCAGTIATGSTIILYRARCFRLRARRRAADQAALASAIHLAAHWSPR